jgi:hypothetical protein
MRHARKLQKELAVEQPPLPDDDSNYEGNRVRIVNSIKMLPSARCMTYNVKGRQCKSPFRHKLEVKKLGKFVKKPIQNNYVEEKLLQS